MADVGGGVPKPRKYYAPASFISVNGLRTAYRRKGRGEPLLFLHGGGSTRMWLPVYERFAQAVDFIAPEHPGFGETPRPEWLRGFEDLVIHYDELLAQLGIEEFHVAGWSVGGWIAAELASYFPRRLKTLTLITPIGLRLVDQPGVDLFKLLPGELLDVLFNDKAAMETFAPDADDFEEICQLHGEMATLAKLIWAPRYNLSLEWRLRRVTCPCLVVNAENDRLVPGAMGERFAELLDNARTVTIAETGHALCLERPDQTAGAILGFLRENGYAKT